MADPTVVVREQVQKLLDARPDVTQIEFGKAIGRGFSWVSAFLSGTRHANDLRLVARIARYFGVSVGYLLRESERGRDAGAMTLLTTWETLEPGDRQVLLQLALNLRRRGGEGGEPGSPAPGDAPEREAGRTPPARGKPRARTRR